MSKTVIEIHDDEFKRILKQVYKEGAEEMKRSLQQNTQEDDEISEEEVLSELGCGKSKLAKLRSSREIVYYTHTRPYTYSRKSVIAHKARMAV